jgi:uncharacterized protein YjaG (DUF416 family)
LNDNIIGCEFKANDAILAGNGIPGHEPKGSNVPFHAYKLNFDVFYCFSAPKSTEHKNGGLVKIGKASFSIENNVAKYSGKVIGTILNPNAKSLMEIAKVAAGKRIKQYTNTVGITVDLHWVEISRVKNMTDTSIHKVLEKNGYKRHDFNNGSTAQEWYPVSPDVAKNAFLIASKGSTKESDYVKKILRPEQNLFLANTKKAFLDCTAKPSAVAQRLWDAKMRFGKTMTAMELVKAIWEENPILIKRVHIITHRPTGVEDNWRASFQDVFRGTNWQYATKSDLVLPSDVDVNAMPMQNQNNKESRYGFDRINPAAPLIYFSSMQDMRGKNKKEDSDFKKSNEKIYKEQWDLVIVDEAQEGNTTDLAVEVHDKLTRKFTLLLSGTPYKYLETGQFKEEEIDSWDYVMEQEAKEAWDAKVENGETSEPNPYQNPKMWIQAIDIRDITMNAYANSTDSGYDNYFDFSSMFKTLELDGIEQFVEKESVNAFLDNISRDLESEGANTGFDNSHMPYSLARRESNQHALWVLPSVDSCKAMAKALGEHKFFKDYTVVNVAGNDKEAKNASDSVSKAIEASDRTITLTVGRMTVGATVKEWSAVLMLCNTNSAASYMQTIFRVQSPHDQLVEINGETVLKTKTDAFVWDFAPDRVLRVFTDVSEVSVKAGEKSTAKSEESLKRLLTFLPIVSYIQNGDMKVLDAGDVIRELKRVYSQRVVSNGFESPFLFVRDYSNLPDDFREALENIRAASINSIPTLRTVQGDPKVTIAHTGLDNKSEKELLDSEEEFEEKAKKRDLSDEEEAERKRINEEINQRKSITYLLNTISVRIPYLVLALNADKKFSKEFLRINFKFETLLDKIDDQSWFEVFGFVSKADVLKVIPAFDEVVLHSAIINLLDELEKAISLMDSDYEEYAKRIISIIARLRNPNKETVMTPYPVVEIAYQAAGFMDEKDFALAIAKADNKTPTFFDINVKSGLFPFHAALNIKRVSSENLKLSELADKYIYANSRTPVGKMITATLLGKDKDWDNITVIDILEEKEKLEREGIKDKDAQELLISSLLKEPMVKDFDLSGADILTREEKVAIVKENLKNIKDGVELSTEVKQALHADTTFDFVISNPPYQMRISENNKTANSPIWPDFVKIAVKIGKLISIINPARWQKGASGTGLVKAREWILSQSSFTRVINLEGEVFPTASIEGGVCVEIFNTNNTDAPKISTWNAVNGFQEVGHFSIDDDIDVIINKADETIVLKVIKASNDFIKDKIIGFGDVIKTVKASSRIGKKPEYRLKSNRPSIDAGYLLQSKSNPSIQWGTIYYRDEDKNVKKAYLPMSEFQKNAAFKNVSSHYKVAFPTTRSYSIYRNNILILSKNEFTTQSFIGILFPNKKTSMNFKSYLQTYFVRYLATRRSVTQSAYANIYRWVPDLTDAVNPRTGKTGWDSDWTDDDLAIFFKRNDGTGLTKEDWEHIKAEALKADNGKGDYEGTSSNGQRFVFPDGSMMMSLTFKDKNGKDIF